MAVEKSSRRLFSMDVLRGLTIAFMIMVNNNGGSGSWWFMSHARWNGLTPTDLVFPTFLFVVGVSIAFAFESRLARGDSRQTLALHAARRAGILILLGIVVNSFPLFQFDHMRFYGVLQRIGICYLAVGLFYLWDRRVWTKIVAVVALLVGYWALLRWVPVPGAGKPVSQIPFLDPSQNLAAWLDRQLLPGHLYEDHVTHCLRDPEGLLSDLPAVATALLGLLTGLWLRTTVSVRRRAAGLLAGSLFCLASGYLWSLEFPLNKKLWTSSYTLVAAGWSLAVFALVFWLIEVRDWRGGWTWPWKVFGSNAIVAYMFSELIDVAFSTPYLREAGAPINLTSWLMLHVYGVIPSPGLAAFSYSFSYMAMCFVPVLILYRKKIFVKI